MLEVLDPEQNNAFSDHYLEMALRSLQGHVHYNGQLSWSDPSRLARSYGGESSFPVTIEEEKLEIANRYLIPRQIEENGISDIGLTFEPGALQRIIREYTFEAGVRNLGARKSVGSAAK